MDGRKLQDRLYLGFGLSARHIGRSADAFRPAGPSDPLDKRNRFLRLPAAFISAKGKTERTNVYGEALWHGIFDGSYTQPGDYLVLEADTFFIASQAPLLPLLCVRTNRRVSIARPNVQSNPAMNSYGGYFSGTSAALLQGWPACVLGENRSGSSSVNLPTDQSVAFLNILLPAGHGILLSCGDLVTDDIGRTAIIAECELTNLGWRLSAKMATT